MEEYSIFLDYKKAMDHREAQYINGRYQIDAEELAYWKWLYNEEIKEQEKESEEPF